MGKITRLLSLAAFVMFGSNIICAAATYPKNKGKGIVYPTAVEYNVEYNGTTKINDIQKIDYSHGWAVGNDGLVLKKNGSWTAVDLGMAATDPQTNYNFNAIHCLESNNLYIWVVGENKANNSGIIRRSTDGGTTWLAPSSPLPQLPAGTAFKGVSFSNTTVGYIACGNGIVLKSNDGGASWAKTPSPVTTSDGVSIHYQDVITRPTYPNLVWVIGDNCGVLAASTDGGATWPAKSENPLPSAISATYKWPGNTLFNVPLALGPNEFAADGVMLGTSWSWGATYNHGYYYNGSALTQIAPNAVWLNGADLAGSGKAVSGSDGFTVYGDGVSNNVDMTAATLYPTGYMSSHFTYAGNNGKIYSPYYPPYAVDAGCAPTGVAKQIKVEWSSMYPLAATSIEIYKCESLLGMPYPPCATVSGSATSWTDNYANYNMNYHYWIKPVNGSGTTWIYAGYCKPSSGDVPSPAPAAPTNVTATDISYDHGEGVYLTWSGSTTFYHVGRRIAGTTNFYPIVTIDEPYYYDYSAKNGFTYEYVVISEQGNSFTPSAYSSVVSCMPIDDIAPSQLPLQTGYYDATNRIITLNWQPSTDDPNFGGYWLCPEPLGEFASVMLASSDPGGYEPDAYHVEHAAPLQRTTYKYYVPDNYLGQTLGFSVTAMDRSGNMAPWSQTFAINTKAFTNSNVMNATAYNNGRHLIYDNNGKLHLTYTSVDSVFYQNSIDDGYTWSGPIYTGAGLYSGGINPSSVIGVYGEDTTLTWKAETTFGWVLKSATRNEGLTAKWTDPQTILEQDGYYDQLHLASPPSMAMNAAGTHLVLETVDRLYNFGPSYGWKWNIIYGFKPAGGTAFTWTTLDSASGVVDHDTDPRSPTICIDAKGGIHVAWDYEGEIYWKMYDPYIKGWKEKVNVSNSPDVFSDEPSLALFGDVHIVWQEGNDIYHQKGNWNYVAAYAIDIVKSFYWQGSENVDPNSSGTASLNPVFDGNYIAWSEGTADGLNKACYANYADFAWVVNNNYSNNPTQSSVYPQIAYRQNADGNKMTTVWTEGAGPKYSLISRDSAGQVTAQLAADIGGTEPSIYTIERDGYLVYTAAKSKAAGITVDYDSTQLLYYLPDLNREQKQTVKINLYQEYTGKTDYIYQIWVDNASLGTIKVPSGKMVTFVKDLPNTVSHDGEGVLKIVNLKKGTIVTCDNWQLFAYDKDCDNTKLSGAQANLGDAKPIAFRYELMQNAPNPCSKQTMINYQLAKQGQVSLKVYNTLGQVVKTLVNESQNPGSYSVKWNGNDEAGRQAAAGIYFYRIASGEFNSTKKMVVLK